MANKKKGSRGKAIKRQRRSRSERLKERELQKAKEQEKEERNRKKESDYDEELEVVEEKPTKEKTATKENSASREDKKVKEKEKDKPISEIPAKPAITPDIASDVEGDSFPTREHVQEAFEHDSFTEDPAAIQNQLLSEETTSRDAGTRTPEKSAPTATQDSEAIIEKYEKTLPSKDAEIQRLEGRNKALEVAVAETFAVLKGSEALKEKCIQNLKKQVETLEQCILDMMEEAACSGVVFGPGGSDSCSR
ncbi:uncharacterized protein BDZ99DRAFT_513001 [Mytilinidion resinicola]|uniref:Uncharacterized protein n=1 Tax=Mytilinidion resinicola TaxID=574789 RepID=A0A6A6Z6R4_9PEZI|nr:uncharacterized protein BDZ99DRAFT_513001 [Mytilinidion resinicola]KAF2816720.1 hypothetical protein BDZ99DRAFT_513001 [Mytilinidion resinicola]